MKRLLIPLLCLLSAAAYGQVTGTIPSTGGGTVCVNISVGPKASQVAITITGTWSGTLQPELSLQGQAAANTQITPSTSSTAASTITANGTYFTVNVAGADTFLLCGNTVASGTANVYLNISTAGAARSGGAGAGGVTSIATTSPITGGTITTTGTIACATCTTNAAALTLNQVVLGAGAQASKVDTALSTDGAGAATGVSFATSGTNGGLSGVEGTGAGVPAAAGTDNLWADSTAHRWKFNVNNSAAFNVPGVSAAGTSAHCVQFAANGIDLADSGGACAASGLPSGLTFVSPTFTISSSTNGNGVLALSGNTSGTATFTAPAVAGISTNPALMSNVLQGPNGALATPTFQVGTQGSGGLGIYSANGTSSLDFAAAGVRVLQMTNSALFPAVPICDFTTGNNCITFASGLISTSGSGNPIFKPTSNVAILTSDFTDSNASGLQVITGLAIALPNSAKNYSFHCAGSYSQATPISSDQFGVASLTTAPTNLKAQAHVITTEGATAVQTTGNSGNISSTTPTSIVTFTPVGTGEKPFELDGSIEASGSGASTLQFYVTNGTAADVIVVKRDTYCRAF